MRRPFSIRSRPLMSAMAMLTFALLYIPLAILVVYAFNDGASMASWEGFSLRWFEAAWRNDQVVDASINSLQVAVVAAVVATILATMAAIGLANAAPSRSLNARFALINQPLIVPEIVTAVALLIVFSRVKVWTGYTGFGYLYFAHAAFCVPFAYLPIQARLRSMDRVFEAAAADLYATPLLTFRRVTFPLLWPGIAAGLMLSFIVSLDNVVITEFVKSAGQDTLPTYMLGQLRRSVSPEMNAISTAFLVLSFSILAVFFMTNRSVNRNRTG